MRFPILLNLQTLLIEPAIVVEEHIWSFFFHRKAFCTGYQERESVFLSGSPISMLKRPSPETGSHSSLSKARCLGGNIKVRLAWAALRELRSSSCLGSRREVISSVNPVCPEHRPVWYMICARAALVQCHPPIQVTAVLSRPVLIVTCLLKVLCNYLSVSIQ